MPVYQNLPSNTVELLDGNLIIDTPIEGNVVLVIGTALSGQSRKQVLMTDSNVARAVYGAGSSILQKASEIKLGGAKNVLLYRIGGKSASILNLFGTDSYITTVEETASAGSKYSVYIGPQPSNPLKACVIVFSGAKIVYSNVPGSEVDLGKIKVEGFVDTFTGRVGTPTAPVLLENALSALVADVVTTATATAGQTDFNLPLPSSASTVIEYVKVNGNTQATTAYTLSIGNSTTPDKVAFGSGLSAGNSVEIKFNKPLVVSGSQYVAGEDNINPSWKKLYEMLDTAYADLETTIATEIYVDGAILDAPNVADGSTASNKLGYLLRTENDAGEFTYEWSNSKTLYRASETFSGNASAQAHFLTGAASADTQIISVSIGGTPTSNYVFDASGNTVTLNAASGTNNISVVYAKPTITAKTSLDTSGQPIIYKQFSEVNFAHRFGEFLHALTTDDKFALGFIGTSTPTAYSNAKIAEWMGKLPEKDIEGTIIANGTGLLGNKFMSGTTTRTPGFYKTDTGLVDGVAQQDRNGAYIDLGKFLSIVPGLLQLPVSPISGTNGGIVNGAAVYCGMVTQVTPGNSTTNALVPKVSVPFVIKKPKLNSFAGSGYVMFQLKDQGVVVSSGELATNANSDYDYISTSIIVRDFVNSIRVRLDPYIGKGIDQISLAAMQTAVEGVIRDKIEAGAIKKGVAQVIPSSVFGVEIPYTLAPKFELREIDNVVKLSYDI